MGRLADTDTVADLLRGHTGTALVCADDGEALSYDELSAVVDGVARQLAGHGIVRGDRVALVPLLLGVVALGAMAAPLNPAYTRDEFAFYLDDLAPAALLVPEGKVGPARAAAAPSVAVLDVRGTRLVGPAASA